MARAPRIEEERPPHDMLEGVSLPRQTTILAGQQHAELALLSAYRSGRMPHGWILAGNRGIGRATLAFRLARFVLANPKAASPDVTAARDLSVPDDHPVTQRIAAGTHGNLLHMQREWNDKTKRYRTQLSVDTVRRITPFLGSTAAEEGWRVIIVDTADDLNPSAANALLKNLEEPPRNTLFLLVASTAGGLLPTIVSRCRVLRLDTLSIDDVDQVTRQVAPDLPAGRDAETTAALAGGSARRLIELRQSGGLALYRLMRSAIEGGDASAQLRLSALVSDAAGMAQFMDLFEEYLARRVSGRPEPAGGANAPAAPLVTFAELWEKAARSGQKVEEYNLDRRQFALDLVESAAAAMRETGSRA